MSRCSFLTGRRPGSVFGLTRREEELASLKTMSMLCVRRPNIVSYNSDLTVRSADDPEEREREPDDEDIAIFILLGVRELPRRQEKAGGGGYSYLGELPPSMCSRTASNVRSFRISDSDEPLLLPF
ncbi:hypothetical protein D1007_52191 [Hordeum vulgare]|nr:hypothetical protein D1007_52191 [Hordeum vulgare]